MNKKSKNKNRSKPPNPTPPTQNPPEPLVVTEEITAIVAEEKQISLVKESDSVNEIKSETIEPSIEDSNKTNDTPKKPKRNKGKKKKQEDVSLEEIASPVAEAVFDESPVPVSEVKVKNESVEETVEVKAEEENKNIEELVTASVRKKKNKKKLSEPQKVEESVPQTVATEKEGESFIEQDKNSSEIKPDNITPELLEESDGKQSKKKNKKKKHRLDSEKSDKAEEVVICTAAFQELLSLTDKEGNVKEEPEQKLEPVRDSKKDNKIVTTTVKEETLKDLIESVLISEEHKQSEDEAAQHGPIDEPKSKKKNKKDKKQSQPKNENEGNRIAEDETIKSNVISDVTQETPLPEQKECVSQETVEKPKAKIAKPVEKKRKGKTGTSESHENRTEDINISRNVKARNITSDTDKLTEDKTLHSESDQNLNEISLKIIEETIVMSPEASEMFIPTEVKNPPKEAPHVENVSDLADINVGIKSNEAKIESSVLTSEAAILIPNTEPESTPNISTYSPPSKEIDSSITPEPYKTVEKKKKKHPKKIDVSHEKDAEEKILVSTSEAREEKSKQKLDVKPDLSEANVETPGDVEISSIQTDDINLSSDTTPDFIQHPLAASQQFSDDNNNTIIREITATDAKLILPLLIPAEPIIQDSGETPEPIGEKRSKSPSLLVTREKSATTEPEKTDLKSKMMEVSQDMEELRLSIERSLAELTSMEKSEMDIDRKFDEIKTPKLDEHTIKNEDKEENKLLGKNTIETTIKPKTPITSEQPIKQDTPITSKQATKQETPSKSEGTPEILQLKTEILEMLPKSNIIQEENIGTTMEQSNDDKNIEVKETLPQAPARKDHKGKGKGKRKGRQEVQTIQAQQTASTTGTATVATSENTSKEIKKEEKEQSEQKTQSSESNQNKGKQQAMQLENYNNETGEISNEPKLTIDLSFEPIENFEDALTSSVDDVNKTFEMIANEVNNTPELTLQNPKINVTEPPGDPEAAKPKQNPVSPPKNLLGHPDIPVPSNRTDYKKEKNKPPNMLTAKVKIKDSVDVEKTEKSKQSKESQTVNKLANSNKNALESFSYMTNGNAEYVYKYSFRKVFLQSLCHVCRKELVERVPCQFCSLVFYCSQKHKDEDWAQHQALCFALCTIVHLKEQKHIYADARSITGQNYRLLRMQAIISCEKVLKRKLIPWEQEALLYPRVCADAACREWRQNKLSDCTGCRQLSYCSDHPDHLPREHQRWCRSYSLYQRLVRHQQTSGRLEPKLPSKLLSPGYRIPDKLNEVLAAMYDEKIDMSDMEYAALTQLATAPLTAAYCHQLASSGHTNGIAKKQSLVVHLVGAELQFEADVLFKWEHFFQHLHPAQQLRVVLVGKDLNPSNLPLHLLGKLNLCKSCQAENRNVTFSFQDRKSYYEYWSSDEFYAPDIVCAFNSSIQRSSIYNGKDSWPNTINCILKLKTPFVISSYSIDELTRDLARVKECSELSGVSFKTISEPKCNPFASVRPDRNFITDDEIPLLFKNYCFTVLCGV